MEFIAPSGAKVVINSAPWRDAKQLKKAIEREIMVGGLNIPTILMVDSSDAVDAALWPCLARCLRNDQKIVEMTFDDLEARIDYYDIALECIKVNLGPLAERLRSKLQEFGLLKTQAPTKDAPKSASKAKSGSQPAGSQS